MTSTTETRYSITEHFLDAPYGPTRYWASEPKQGYPILLVHGYGALIEHWRPIMRPLARTHTLYALDLYYFGYSARPSSVKPSKELWAAQLATFIEQVIKEPTVVVGHSMGGIAVAQLARDYPQLVRSLVLVCSSGMLNPERPPSPTDQLLFNITSAPLFGELIAGVFANEWGVRQGLLAAYYRKEKVTQELVDAFSGPLRKYGGSSYLAVTRSFNSFILDIKPGEVTVPTMLLWGAEDRSIPPMIAPYFKERMLPQAEIQIIPKSGHCPFDETPEDFCNILLPWMTRV